MDCFIEKLENECGVPSAIDLYNRRRFSELQNKIASLLSTITLDRFTQWINEESGYVIPKTFVPLCRRRMKFILQESPECIT